MGAMFAISSCDDRPDSGWVAHKTPRPKTGLGNGDGDGAEKLGLSLGLGLGLADILFTTDFRWRSGSVRGSMQRDPTCPSTAPISTAEAEGLRPTPGSLDPSPLVPHHPWTAHVRGDGPHRPPLAPVSAIAIEVANSLLQSSRLDEQSQPRKEVQWNTELLETAENPLGGDIEPPPSYDDSARDILPPYTLDDSSVHRLPPPEPRLGGIDPSKRTALALAHHMTAPKPDWGATSNFRQVAKKKKNQKKGGQDNWEGSGDEGKKDGGIDGEKNGDDAGDGGVGGAGAGAGGGGDDGDGGAGDGGGDDEWNSGKKKKKGKKAKAPWDEEEEKKAEEERKMKEQEEEEERKRKEEDDEKTKKEEEEAVLAGGPPSWPDGGDADPGLDWGFTKPEKKAKKGKKAKAEEEERKLKEQDEEDERKRKEEEDEKKRKEEEEAVLAGGPPSWPDGGEADPGLDWGFTKADKKAKKGKKGKAEEEEERKSKEQDEEDERKRKEEENEKKRKEEEEAVHAGGPSWPDGGEAEPGLDWGFTKAEKKAKKGKKGKAEEEERKRKEEEEEEEMKRKEGEEAAEAAKAADPLSWADAGQADTTAGWEGFTTTEKKGKKAKKGNEAGDEKKKTEEQAATVASPLAWADGGHADTDPAWSPFGTTDKKAKKAKKGKFEPLPDPTPDPNAANSASFDNIDLGDAPQIDISFGGGALNKIEPKMDFLNFGTNWNTPNSLDTYDADTGTADITDTINSTAIDEGNAWGFSDSKKKKKQATTAGSGFGNYDTQEALEPQPKLDDVKEEGNGIWGGAVVPAGKKEKKGKKKGGADDFFPEPVAIVTDAAVTDPLNNAEDTFTPFTAASSKNAKKKGKKGGLDASISEIPSIFEPPPPTGPPADEEWGSFGTSKERKKGKKGVILEPEKKEEPIVNLPEEPDTGLGFAWGFPKKDKKKGKNILEEESIVPEEPLVLAAAQPAPEDEQDKEFSWGFGSKKSKKSKKGAEEEPTPSEEQLPPITSEPAFEEVGGWDFGSKKDKKKGKKIAPEENEQNEQKDQKGSLVSDFPDPDPEAPVEAPWNAFGAKKDRKKGKKDTFGEFTPAADLNIIEVPEAAEPPPIVEEPFLNFGKKKDKKNKKGLSEVKEDPIVAVDSSAAAAAATTFVAENDWLDWGVTDKKKDKKGKKGSEINEAEETSVPPPPLPEVPEVSEPFSFGGWSSSKKDKKGKNTKNVVPEPPLISVPDPVTNFLADDNEGDWGGSWGFTGRDKKKKEELELELELEQREKEKQEEQERLETEKVKEKQLAEKEKEKEKSKPGKKGRTNSMAAASKPKDVAAEPNADAVLGTEGDSWGAWATSKAKDKKKGGRKDAVLEPPPPAPTPPAQGLTPEPTPEPFAEVVADFDDYNGNSWGSVAPAKAKGKKDGKKGAKAGEFKADSTAPKEEPKDSAFDFLQDNDQDEWSKDLLEEETPAKAAKSFWGLMPGSTTKSKPSKEKDKEAAEAKKAEGPNQDLIDLDLMIGGDSLIDIIDEPVSKGVKSKAGSKVGSVVPRESDKSSKLGDQKKKGGWNVADSWGAAVAVTTAAAEEAADTKAADDDKFDSGNTNTNAKGDGWSFWGATKKTSGNSGFGGKLADEPKKEISKYGLTNQNDSLDTQPFSFSKEPEPSWLDDQAEPPKSTKPTKPPMSSTKPVTKLSSVAARVKALEKEKEKDKGKIPEPATSPPVRDFEPLTDAQPPPKKPGVTAKSRAATASKSASWEKKDLLPPAAEESKGTAEFVPGSFPAEGADDEIVDVITAPVVKKPNKKKAKPKQAPAMNPIDLMDLEDVADSENSPDPGTSANSRPSPPPPAPEAPPTPPPEPVASKPAKKERARVVRDEGASSWGFWGASPKKAVKKEVKAKDDADIPSPFSKEKEKPGLARSKTTKVGKEKETEKSSGKSSGSDKEKKAESRPSKPRGSGFGGLFGGPPPARPKPVRRPSAATPKNASRRQSMDIDALGLPSPPEHDDVPEISSKAAKVMGTSSAKLGRKESVRGKPKVSGKDSLRSHVRRTSDTDSSNAAVPDPYPIDDDDMVMVNGLEDPIINAPIPKMPGRKDKGSKTRAGKEVQFTTPFANNKIHMVSETPERNLPNKLLPDNADGEFDLKQTKHAPDVVDDVVMVESGPSNDGMGSPVAQEDLAFTVERPKPLQRASTSARKPGNSKLMGLFGGFQKSRRMSETYERTRSKNLGDNDERHSARKRTATGEDDGAKRIRRDDRRIRRADRPDVTINGLIIDPPERDEGVRLGARNSESKREERRATRASREVSSNEVRDPDISIGQDRGARPRESTRARDDGQAKVRDSRDKKARKEEDQDALRHEERRAKRAAAKEDYAPQDLGFDIPEKKSKHRERESAEASTPRNAAEASSRPHRSDRRRNRADQQPLSPSGEPERRPHRSRRATTGERSSHRKAVAPLEDYFDPRNGAPPEPLQPDLPPLTQESHEPYMHGANDQTSSWVKSQISEPAPPPPLEPSVLDPTPVLGPVDDDDEAEQEARRAARKKERRRSKYGEAEDDAADRRRRRRSGREGMKSSEGSGDGDRPERERRRSEYIGREGRGFVGVGTGLGLGMGTGMGLGTGLGGGGGGGGKRGSWFKKIGLQI